MPRNIWTGSISFGLVNVPVALQAAVTEKSVRFKQVNGKTGALVKQKRVDASTGNEVDFEDIVKGYELTPDRYVFVTPEEIDALVPARSKRIEIEEFTDPDGIDPLAYDYAYWVVPVPGGEKAFAMLGEGMLRSGKVGIGRVVMRTKEYVVALRADARGGLSCTTLLYADEINNPGETWDQTSVTAEELTLAGMLIDAISSEPFRHDQYRDGFRERVLDLVERKAAGMPPAEAPEDEAPAPAADLLSALEASLAAVRADEPGLRPGTIRAVPVPEEDEVAT